MAVGAGGASGRVYLITKVFGEALSDNVGGHEWEFQAFAVVDIGSFSMSRIGGVVIAKLGIMKIKKRILITPKYNN
jgi:hypothetical protein